MQKSKNTKRLLLASILAMMLCVAMLVCSTFAWFTDSVTSANNQIVAGNLDVELYSLDEDGNPTKVTADTELFNKDARWEPGYTEVINLKVVNEGTLALKYQFGVNVVDEKAGTNVANETFKLSDYIKFAVVDGNNKYASREDAIAAADATATLISELSVDNNGVLYPDGKGESSKYVTLIAYMPTTVGNEANYKKGTEAPEITLGVNLVATQTPYEEDSFDKYYDTNAPIPVKSASEVQNVLANWQPMTLDANVTMPKENPIVMNSNKIDLNNHNMTASMLTTYYDGTDITISNGTINQELPENYDEEVFGSYPFLLEFYGANNVLENVVVNAKNEAEPANQNAIYMEARHGDTTLTLKGNTVINGNIFVQDGATLIIEEGVTINGIVEYWPGTEWAGNVIYK